MNNLKAGFSRGNINPPMGIPIRGYFKKRLAEAIIDDLEVNALALQCENVKTILITIDHCGIAQRISEQYKNAVSDAIGVPAENILLFCDSYSHST